MIHLVKVKGNSMRCHVILVHEGGGLIKTTLHSLKLMSRKHQNFYGTTTTMVGKKIGNQIAYYYLR